MVARGIGFQAMIELSKWTERFKDSPPNGIPVPLRWTAPPALRDQAIIFFKY
jgi:hypothetical protein